MQELKAENAKHRNMKATEQTINQIGRFVGKVAQKFPWRGDDTDVLTDIHVRVAQDSGEMMAFDDEDREITRCVVEQWIDNREERFYADVTDTLRRELGRLRATQADTTLKERKEKSGGRLMADSLGIMRPYSWVLESDEGETLGELFVADDDTVIISGELLEGLDKDLDDFFRKLMETD